MLFTMMNLPSHSLFLFYHSSSSTWILPALGLLGAVLVGLAAYVAYNAFSS